MPSFVFPPINEVAVELHWIRLRGLHRIDDFRFGKGPLRLPSIEMLLELAYPDRDRNVARVAHINRLMFDALNLGTCAQSDRMFLLMGLYEDVENSTRPTTYGIEERQEVEKIAFGTSRQASSADRRKADIRAMRRQLAGAMIQLARQAAENASNLRGRSLEPSVESGAPTGWQREDEPSDEPRPRKDEFVGREEVLARLSNSTSSVINLYGVPGMGKTSVVRKWAADHGSGFAQEPLRLELNGCGAGVPLDATDVARDLLKQLGLEPSMISDNHGLRFGQLTECLRGMHRLLVLDNADEDKDFVEVARAAVDARVLITSRGPLVKLRTDMDAELIKLGALSVNEAEELLKNAIGADLFVDLREKLEALNRRVDGSPLALKWVAQQLVLDPDSIDDIDVIEGIRTAFDWSYNKHTPNQQKLLWSLASAPQRHFERELVRELARSAGNQSAYLALVQHSLLDAEGQRFTLHDLVREFALDKAREASFPSDHVARKAVQWELDRIRQRSRKLRTATSLRRSDAALAFNLFNEFDELWGGVNDCLDWLRGRPGFEDLYLRLAFHAGWFLMYKADWEMLLRDAIPAYDLSRASGKARWQRRFSRQLDMVRRGAHVYSQMPGLMEPTADAVRRIESILGLTEWNIRWDHVLGMKTAEFPAEQYIQWVRDNSDPRRDLESRHLDLCPPPVRRRVEAYLDEWSRPIGSTAELVSMCLYWADAAYIALSTEDEPLRTQELVAETVLFLETYLALIDYGINTDTSEFLASERRVRLSSLYRIQGESGSEKDIRQLELARERFKRNGSWIAYFSVTKRLAELAAA